MPTPNPDYTPNPQQGRHHHDARADRARAGRATALRAAAAQEHARLLDREGRYASFDFTVEKPGTFTVEVLQGCGKGSGGAEVELLFDDPGAVATVVTFTVKDTGGFQNFEAREVGTLKIERPGRHTLIVKPKTKPGVAVMDLRQVVLKPK